MLILISALNVTALVMIFLLLPETKQRTLEELDYVFAVPTGRHMSYQVRTVLPWWFKRYVLFQKGPECPPLYKFDTHLAESQGRSQSISEARRGSRDVKTL